MPLYSNECDIVNVPNLDPHCTCKSDSFCSSAIQLTTVGRGGLNTEHLNTEHIGILNVLKF